MYLVDLVYGVPEIIAHPFFLASPHSITNGIKRLKMARKTFSNAVTYAENVELPSSPRRRDQVDVDQVCKCEMYDPHVPFQIKW